MTERPLQKMNHIAGARALVKDCEWNAQSKGNPAGCFWFNISTELLNCVVYNWSIAWDPDDWGYQPISLLSGKRMANSQTDEHWAHAVIYILALTVQLRATATNPKLFVKTSTAGVGNVNSRWAAVKRMCDSWQTSHPQSLRPVLSSQTSTTSCFPYFR